jgi:hypothetical protein
MKAFKIFLVLAAAASFAVIAAASWHSVEEIHYLKTFYPSKFTVEEASMAAEVELIKVLLISLPLVIVIAAALYILRTGIKDKSP